MTVAKSIVDEYLASHFTEGMSAEALLKGYKGYGEDPFISGGFEQEGYRDEFLKMANSYLEQMDARRKEHGGNFEEMNKPLDLPESKVLFSAWEYAEKRCEELCRSKEDDLQRSPDLSAEMESKCLKMAEIGAEALFSMSLKSLIAEGSVDSEMWLALMLAGARGPEELNFVNALASDWATSK